MTHAQRMGEYLRYRSAVGLRLSELAILVTARHWSQQVEWAVHAPIALKAGIAQATIDAIAERREAQGMPPDDALVYEFCRGPTKTRISPTRRGAPWSRTSVDMAPSTCWASLATTPSCRW
jgi:hypothetical protein